MHLNEKIEFEYQSRLLETWESVYKKGQLTLWILLSLKHGKKPMGEIKLFIETQTNNTLSADDKSMYRALRRFYQMKMVDYTDEPSIRGGPDRKIYYLTPTGENVLKEFVQKNIIEVYYKTTIESLMKGTQ